MRFLFPLLLLPVVVWGYCDPGFTLVGEKCLSFETHYQMSFEEAREYCNEMRGASLVAIDSPTQFKSLVDYMYAEGMTSYYFWVDGNDKETDGVWLTSSGKEFPMGTPFWCGYPTQQEPNGGSIENCAHLYNKFYINDISCNRTHAFICEQAEAPPRKITNEVPEVKSCPMHYVEIGGKCLSFLTYEETTWEEARSRCRDKEGDLAIVDDIELLREINLYLKAEELTDHDFWLGASDAKVEGQWVWTDGSAVSMGTPFWGLINWTIQEPDGGAEENYLALLSKGYFYFRDVSGDLALHPLCQLTE